MTQTRSVDSLSKALRGFWKQLHDGNRDSGRIGSEQIGAQRTRIDLMRARNLDDVLISEGFSAMLSSIGFYPDDKTRLAIVGGVLGLVTSEPNFDGYTNFGHYMGHQGYPKSRFKRLMDVEKPEHLFRQLCSVAGYLDDTLPVSTGDRKGLVETVLRWPLAGDEKGSDKVRQQFAQDYYTNLEN